MAIFPRVALVVPCYNEAARLQAETFLSFVATRPHVRLHFVDDGSHDETFARLQAMLPRGCGRITIRRLESNVGKAEAVRTGLLDCWADANLVGFWDADLATPLEALDDFIELAERRRNVEMILGSRVALLGRDIHRRTLRHYISRVFATGASLALKLPVYDTQCGAKLFRATADLRPVFDRPFRSRWVFDVELLARYLELPVSPGASARADRIYELAVPAWYDVAGSKLRLLDGVRAYGELFTIWRSRRRSSAR